MDRTVFQFSRDSAVPPGTQLNGLYEIESLIGKGGMGEVYKGYSLQGRDAYAIKMILRELSNDESALALFRREASTLRKLQHDAIVRYYVDAIDPKLQRAYLAMEFVDGVSLKSKLSSGKLSVDDVLVLKDRVASGLDAAHRLGVVHRDISSDNLILPDGDVRQAKIIDFGIARSTRVSELSIISGGFAGKGNYISPEQVYGRDATAKSDIYSFGLVLAEALRGRPIDMGGSYGEIVEKRRGVPDLSGIDSAFEPLLRKMLQPNPDERSATMAEVAAWRPAASRGTLKPPPLPRGAAAPAPRASHGRWSALIGGLIILASLGGTLYVFRDDVSALTDSLLGRHAYLPPKIPGRPTDTAVSTKPKPDVAPKTTANPIALPPASPMAKAEAPAAANTAVATPPPTVGGDVTLPRAVVGQVYRGEVPSFADPSAKGLRVIADGGLPEGLILMDLGNGESLILGTPKAPGTSTFSISAVDDSGQSSVKRATVEVAPAPEAKEVAAPPTLSSSSEIASQTGQDAADVKPGLTKTPSGTTTTAKLETPGPTPTPGETIQPVTPAAIELPEARVAEDYSADLPLTAAPNGPLTFHAVPAAPLGLLLHARGPGVARLAGKPTEPGAFSFDVVGADAAGERSRVPVRLTVAPPQVAAISPPDIARKQQAFLAGFDGGPCTYVRGAPDGGPGVMDAFSADPSSLEPLAASFQRSVGVEPEVRSQTIERTQCAVLDLIKRAGTEGDAAPRLTLGSAVLDDKTPLAGTVSGLAGRKLDLLIITNDGAAYELPFKLDGDSASFSEPITFEAADTGHAAAIVAVVSKRPIPALTSRNLGNAKTLVPKLLASWSKTEGAADARFVRLGR